jgi:hypothetical protein
MYFDCSLVAGRKDSLSGENLWVSVLLGFVGLWRRKKDACFWLLSFLWRRTGLSFSEPVYSDFYGVFKDKAIIVPFFF